MAFIIEEHNTFLGLSAVEQAPRRSSSLPRSFKPVAMEQSEKLWSDIMSHSTEAPDDASVDECSSEASTPTSAARELEMPKKPTPLKRSAQIYAPSAVTPFAYVLQCLQLFLQSYAGAEAVDLSHEGSSAEFVCKVDRGVLFRKRLLEGAQQALLAASEGSQTVFVLGYGHEPFKSSGVGFKATLVMVPPQRQEQVCWASCQFGNCRKRATCPWSHPEEFELLEVTLNLDVVSTPKVVPTPAATPKASSAPAAKADFVTNSPSSAQPKPLPTATKGKAPLKAAISAAKTPRARASTFGDFALMAVSPKNKPIPKR
jgi:hypothetical protein